MPVEDRMTSVVAVEYDAAADGSISDSEGAVARVWTALPGFAQQNCLVCDNKSQVGPGQEFSEDLTTSTIMFPAGVLPNDKVLRFRFVDPLTPTETTYYYANGKIVNIPKDKPVYSVVRARQGAIT